MHVLVTGGAGFIGRRLAATLRARGDTVRVLDSFDDSYDPKLKSVPSGVELVRGDCTDPRTVRSCLRNVEGVCHLAARAGVRESLANPVPYAHHNVVGTLTILRAMAEVGMRRMVLASSSSVYGSAGGPFRENDPADRPESPYAASKRAAELFCHSSGLDVSVARLFTVYGPGQRPGMAIAKFVRLAMHNEEIPVFGDGSSLRDYTWVDDAVDGLIRAFDRAAGFRIVNIGGGNPVPLTTVLAAVADATGRRLKVKWLPAQPGDVPITHADPTVAREWLGWTPTMPFHEGVNRYVATL